MTMFQIWLRSEETGATDTVIYIKAESIDTAFDYCNRFRPLLCAKSCFPEGWWIEDEGAKLFSNESTNKEDSDNPYITPEGWYTEEMLEIIDGMEEAA